MKKSAALLLGLAALLAAGDAMAVPNSMTFTGRLSTASGPVDGAVSVTFIVYDASVGGNSQWTDTLSLTADTGLVFATLGTAANPLDETVFDGAPMFLEIHIGAETLSPRLPIGSSPYSVRSGSAENADTLGGTITPSDVVTAVTAGSGLAGGGSGGALSLSVDTSTTQSRVTGTCAAGSSIATITAGGTVTCEVDNDSGGDVTGITAGAGLTGGGASGAVSLAVDTSTIQARVTGACGAGSSIASISAAGAVTCETDDVGTGDITDVTASTGLSGGGSSGNVSLSVNTAVIQSRVSGSCTAGNAIRAVAADGTVTCQATAAGSAPTVTYLNVSGGTSMTPNGSDQLYKTVGTFVKASATSIVQVHYTNHVTMSGGFCGWTVRVDDAKPPNTGAFWGAISYAPQQAMELTGIWNNLAAGTHTVQIYLRGIGTSCGDNSGNFSPAVIVTEIP